MCDQQVILKIMNYLFLNTNFALKLQVFRTLKLKDDVINVYSTFECTNQMYNNKLLR